MYVDVCIICNCMHVQPVGMDLTATCLGFDACMSPQKWIDTITIVMCNYIHGYIP